MKTARKPKDFSIKSILADSLLLLTNNDCKNTFASAFVQTCGINFLNKDKCLLGATGKMSIAPNSKRMFEILQTPANIVNNLDINDKFSGRKNIPVLKNAKYFFHQQDTTKLHGEAINREENDIDHYYVVSKEIGIIDASEGDTTNYLKKGQQKQLEEVLKREIFNGQMKNVNNSKSWEDTDEDLNGESQRKLEKGEMCLSSDNEKKGIGNICKGKAVSLQVILNTGKLEWLKCTRYKPPKIPRKSVVGKNRRKPSIHPRIPFTTHQLDVLEQKFRNSAYLSKDDAVNISEVLHLPPNRVKIWFQNRRARERRESLKNMQ